MNGRFMKAMIIGNLVSFVLCIVGSIFLFGSSVWLVHSFSYLGTGEMSRGYFTVMLMSCVALGLASVSAIHWQLLNGISTNEKKEGNKWKKYVLYLSWVAFTVAYFGLAVAAAVPLSVSYDTHWAGGLTFFVIFGVGMLLLSYGLRKEYGEFLRFLFVIYSCVGFTIYKFTGWILGAEIIMIVVMFMFMWLILLHEGLVSGKIFGMALGQLHNKR